MIYAKSPRDSLARPEEIGDDGKRCSRALRVQRVLQSKRGATSFNHLAMQLSHFEMHGNRRSYAANFVLFTDERQERSEALKWWKTTLMHERSAFETKLSRFSVAARAPHSLLWDKG